MSFSLADLSRSRRVWLGAIVAVCVVFGIFVALRAWRSGPETLRVGCNLYPPYTLPRASGPPDGLAADMIIRAAQLSNIKIDWVFIDKQKADDALASGKIDLFALLTVTEERKARFHMSQPWWENDMALISLEKNKLTTAADTAGRRIATRGMPLTRTLAGNLFPKAALVTITQMEQMLPSLCAGKVDGFFLDLRLVQSQLLKGNGCAGQPLYVASVPDSSLPQATVSTRRAAHIADRLYEEIAQLSSDGTLSRLASKWSMYNPYYGRHMQEMRDAQHRDNLMKYGLAGMTLVLVLTFFQTQRIRRSRAIAEDARREADESRQRFDAFMKFTPAVAYIKNAEGKTVYGNEASRKLFNFSEVVGKFDWELWPPEIAEQFRRNDLHVLATEEGQEFTESTFLPSGELRYFLTLKFPIWNREGQKLIGGVSLDITERKRAEEALRFSQFCIDRSPDTILWVDSVGQIFYANEAASQKLGYSKDELIGMAVQVIDPACTYENFSRTKQQVKVRKSMTLESTHVTRAGNSFPVEVSINYLEFGGGEFSCCMARDITERKRTECEMSYQAQHDLVTGLPNRRMLETRLSQVLKEASANGTGVGVLYIDLDGFKLVNDTLGHVTGDKLLKQVAARLQEGISEGQTLARMGGDEFTLILDRLRDAAEAQAIAQTLLARLNEGFEIDGHDLLVTASAGISMYPSDGLDVIGLLQSSDAAMYEAKRQGKNKVQFFTREMGDAARERLELETQLRRALDRKELSLHYQPQVSMGASGRIVRYEALLRWHHPVLGSIPPSKFIPIAEDTGLIVPIGTWVMEQACRQARLWREASQEDTGVGVNVSVVQFLRPDFVETVIGVLERTGMPPELLELEITESVVMQGVEDPASKIQQLRALGVSISIDDFGTGYSSLSYLQRLPIDVLKIDRSFIRDIASDPNSMQVTAALVSLAHGLSMKVVIEGIETGQQLEAVRTIGCDIVQGFLLGRPAPIESVLFALEAAAA